MKVLVTGGAGFIGSHYVRVLLTGGFPGISATSVTVVDALSYAGNLANLEPVAGNSRLRFVHGDICDTALMDELVPAHQIIVHFAAETHVDRSIRDASPFIRSNVQGTQVLLDAALRHGLRRFVHVSTDEVYGSVDTGSCAEDWPLSPTSPYAASKAASDLLVLAYHRTYGLNVVITRSSNNYGPYQYPEKLIPLFVTRFISGKRAPLYGDGGNERDWLHVDDHCHGVHAVLSKGKSGRVYNIASDIKQTNRDLVARLVAGCGANWDQVENVTDRPGHDRRYSLDTSRIRAELSYRPRVRFEDGLASTIAWYRANRSWWEPLAESDGTSRVVPLPGRR